MKKSVIFVLISVTLVFASYVGGFYVGRNNSLGDTQILGLLPEATRLTASPALPTASTAPSVPSVPATSVVPAGKININTATAQQLETLPGIGPKLAQAIIDYRSEYGDYEVPEDLLHVPGIGEKKLEAMIHLITTGG